jgi:two-component system, chemotaxis family, sensor kinase CheA
MTPDPYRYFRVEAVELAEQLGQGVLELERSPPDPDTIARLLRLAHTLKGAARVVQQLDIAERAHAIEDVLASCRESGRPLSAEAAAELLALLDGVNQGVAALGEPAAVTPGPGPAANQPGGPAAAGPSVAEPRVMEAVSGWRADSADVDGLLDAIGEAQAHLTRLRQSAGGLEALGGGGSRAFANELAALSRIMDQTLEHTERELRDVRASAERLRLVPADLLFPNLRRATRDVAMLQGKRVDFVGSGGEVRVDPYVLSTVSGAMLHAVRNAVAHGIESESRRRAAGKPATGRVAVSVARRGTRVAFACRDDGQGFDLEAVRGAARLAGLSPTEAARLGPEELVALALSGGVTTSSTVTEVSGRGVGLDVVRDVAEQLGGDVVVHTEPGVGATVELDVPLSRFSFTGLVADVAGLTVTIPLDSVRQGLRLTPADVARSASGDTVTFEGLAIPFLPLGPIIAAGSSGRPRPGAAGERAPLVAVVVSTDAGAAAVGVDRLLGTAPVVVQALPELAPAGEMVAGLSLDVDGHPRLVLDPDGLVTLARRRAEAGRPDFAADTVRPRPPVLVIDDSLTTRMLERNILESAGYDVDVASSGEEGLAKARDRRYGLFLVDIEMPGMDGFTFVERTQADPELRQIPSILVSSRASDEDRQRGVRAGARRHVDKSAFDQNELLRCIESLVG